MPWLDNQKSGFLAAFEYFWNSFGASDDNLVCIVCGSATSYLVDNFDNNKGGLFNRQTCRIYLEPFNLYETEQFLIKKKNINWSRYDVAECYMILGGIPYYLDQISRGLSRKEIVEKSKLADNSELTKILRNLVDSGFLRSYPFFWEKKQGTFYQVSDYYTMFYYKFIKENYGKDEIF